MPSYTLCEDMNTRLGRHSSAFDKIVCHILVGGANVHDSVRLEVLKQHQSRNLLTLQPMRNLLVDGGAVHVVQQICVYTSFGASICLVFSLSYVSSYDKELYGCCIH